LRVECWVVEMVDSKVGMMAEKLAVYWIEMMVEMMVEMWVVKLVEMLV